MKVEDEILEVGDNDEIGADVAAAIEDAEGDVTDDDSSTDPSDEGDVNVSSEEEGAEEIPPSDVEGLQDKQPEVGQDTGGEASPVIPPTSMLPEEREKFGTLPVEAQKFLADYCTRRDGDIHRYLTQKGEEIAKVRKVYSELDEVFKPYVDEFRRANTTIADYMGSLLAWDDYIKDDPVAAISELVENHDIDLQHLFDYMQSGERPVEDPHVSEIQSGLEEKDKRIEALEQRYQQMIVENVSREIEAFSKATGSDGELLHPYLEHVQHQLPMFIEQIKAQQPQASNAEILEQAYEQAIWTNPDIRKVLLSQGNTQAKQKAKAAKTAAVSVVDSPGMGPIDDDDIPETIDDAIRKAMGE